MNFSEEGTQFVNKRKDKKDNNENNILKNSKINIKENNNINNNYLFKLNHFLDLLRPSKIIKKKDLEKLNIIFPFCLFIFLCVIKIFISKNITVFYIYVLITLAAASFILINTIIFEKYLGECSFSDLINTLFKDFFKLFIISILPLMIFQYLTFIINIKSIIGKIGNILSILYSTYIAQKLLYGYINIKSAYLLMIMILFLMKEK